MVGIAGFPHAVKSGKLNLIRVDSDFFCFRAFFNFDRAEFFAFVENFPQICFRFNPKASDLWLAAYSEKKAGCSGKANAERRYKIRNRLN